MNRSHTAKTSLYALLIAAFLFLIAPSAAANPNPRPGPHTGFVIPSHLVPTEDRAFFREIPGIMKIKPGTHTIYNGKGTSYFDIEYTIEVTSDQWTVYEGGRKTSFDLRYRIEKKGDIYRICKNGSSVFDVLFSVKITPGGYTVYKGHTTTVFDRIYSYEGDRGDLMRAAGLLLISI